MDTPSLAVDSLVLVGAALLAIGVVSTGLAARVQVPSLLLFLGVGMGVADEGLGLIQFSDAALAQNLSVVALVIILFEGGLSTSWARMRQVAGPAGVLATFGVLTTAAVVAGFAHVVLDIELATAVIIGAVVSSTDAAAVFTATRRAPVSDRTLGTLEAESGLNDPLAVMLTVGTVAAATGDVGAGDWIGFAVRQVVGGLGAGLAIGLTGAWLLRRARLDSAQLYPVLALAVGAGAYGTAVAGGGSGFLAVFLAGVCVAEGAPRHRRSTRDFSSGLAEIAQMGLFFLLGILVFPSDLLEVAGEAALLAVVLVMVARPAAVHLSLLPFGWPFREQVFTAWAGLRGAVPIVLATFPLTAGLDDGVFVFDVVFFVVILSVILQGTTLGTAARRLGLRADPAASAIAVELSPVGSVPADLAEVVLTEHAAVVGRTLAECPPPGGIRVVLVTRGEATIVPGGDTVLVPGDHLVLGAGERTLDVGAVEAWLNGD